MRRAGVPMYESEGPGGALLVTVATGYAVGLDHVLALVVVLTVSAVVLIRGLGRRHRATR